MNVKHLSDIKPASFNVFNIGVPVTVDEVEGHIEQICISKGGVQYQVSWWNGKSRFTEWFWASDVETGPVYKRTTIGFIGNGDK